LGEKIAADIKVRSSKYEVRSAFILALTGELGSGKTTFVQGVARGLGIKSRIISPTFILVRNYEVRSQKYEVRNFYHIDLYRLEKNIEFEVRNLGIKDIWSDPENIVAIEWAEKIEKMIPKSAKWIRFENLGENKRKITMK